MSTYRSRLEAGLHPVTDPRRGPQLRAALERSAESLLPRWLRTGAPDDFGHALLRAGARLAEQTTARLDASARRDALAFYDFLGLPPAPPRPASGVLVLGLNTRQTLPVHAPARTQIAVATADGGHETFETRFGVRLVPGAVTDLYSVDPATDRIERAPGQVVTAAAPPPAPVEHRVTTFSAAGSPSVQLSPAAGLQQGDLVQIGRAVHRVASAEDNGLVSLVDPLEAPAAADSPAARITEFRTFAQRNEQRHEVFIGHRELLNLDRRALITLAVSPASLAGELVGLELGFAMFGTADGDDEPDWHPLEVLGADGGDLRLAKTWFGAVDETEVSGHKSRWIRAELRTPILGRAGATTRAADLRLTVASVPDDAGAPDGQDTTSPEGSRTVLHAAHNGTPLATTGRFYPFGPEPLRFDTFALAAPEALSKKGATVSLAVELADSSMVSFGVAAADAGAPWHGYGAGKNGDLQAIVPHVTGPRWLETAVVDEDGRRVLLGTRSPLAVARDDGSDLVVLADRDGRWWSGIVQHAGTPPALKIPEAWHHLDRPAPPEGENTDGLLVTAAPDTLETGSAVMIDIVGGALHTRILKSTGAPAGAWAAATDAGAPRGKPTLTAGSRPSPVQGPDWPRRPHVLEVLVNDDRGVLWIGALTAGPGTDAFTVSWTPAEGPAAGDGTDVPAAHPGVLPAATHYVTGDGTEHVWVAFATGGHDGTPDGLCGLDLVPAAGGGLEVRSVETEEGIGLVPGSALHTHPQVRGGAGFPAVAGSATPGGALVLWQWRDGATVTDLPGQASSHGPQLVRTEDGPEGARLEVLLPAEGERLLRARLSEPQLVEYSLHDHVEMHSEGIWAPDRLYVATDFDDPGTSQEEVDLERAAPRIYARKGSNRYLRIFETRPAVLAAGVRTRFLRLITAEVDGEHRPRTFAGGPPVPEEPGPDGNDTAARLLLAPDDEHTRAGSRIVVGHTSYVVTGLDAQRVATLNVPLPGDSFDYHVADQYTEDREITTGHLGTLVRLGAGSIPGELTFPAPAVPRIQPVRRTGSSRDPMWAQLAEPWQHQPADATLALVAEELSWTELTRVRDYDNPELSWDYFDGEAWQRLATDFRDSTGHLSTSGTISFLVPRDLATTEIGGKDGYWIRARLVGGDYGRPTYRVTTTQDTDNPGVSTQSVDVDTSELNPPEILSIEASFTGPAAGLPEAVLVDNNRDVLDQTQAAGAPAATFELFQGAAALGVGTPGRALIAGLAGPVGAGPLTLFVDAVDQPGTGTLQVDVRTPGGWRRVPVDDSTASMRRTGVVHLSLDEEAASLRLFGQDRVWLRFRPGQTAAPGAAGRPWAPVLRSLLLNAVPVSHARTMDHEILGPSLGEPGTTVHLAAAPVLPDSLELRVREDLDAEERTAVEQRHRELPSTSPDTRRPAVVTDPGRAPGTWVLWHRVDSLMGQDRDARVYVLEPRTGRVTFGDDRTGRIPPAGRDGIRCFSYQKGGGEQGNVPAWAETRLISAVAGVETAVLPLGTAGGADAPSEDAVFAVAPHQLRHTGRALTPADLEHLAVASSGDVLRARCRRPAGPGEPLRVAVLVRDRTSRRPVPTHAQREALAAHLRGAGWGGLAGNAVEIDGPAYVPVAVTAELIAPRESWADVERSARDLLVEFFDPERGGPHGSGWPFGRRPATTDLLRVLRQVPGVDRIAGAGITDRAGAPVGTVPPDGMVCAEPADVRVSVRDEGSVS